MKGSCYVCESLLRWHAQWSIKVGEILHGTTHKLLYKLYQVILILFHMWKWYLHNFRKFWSTLQHQQLPIPSRRQSHYLGSQTKAAQPTTIWPFFNSSLDNNKFHLDLRKPCEIWFNSFCITHVVVYFTCVVVGRRVYFVYIYVWVNISMCDLSKRCNSEVWVEKNVVLALSDHIATKFYIAVVWTTRSF